MFRNYDSVSPVTSENNRVTVINNNPGKDDCLYCFIFDFLFDPEQIEERYRFY